MDVLKNKQLLNHDGRLVDSEDALKDKALVVYYFSAAWCKPCTSILQALHKIYDENRKRKLGLEVIFVSSDNDQASFSEYFRKQQGNWFAVPFSDPLADQLRYMYSVTNMPTVIVVTKEGIIVTRNGTKEIQANGINVLVMWT